MTAFSFAYTSHETHGKDATTASFLRLKAFDIAKHGGQRAALLALFVSYFFGGIAFRAGAVERRSRRR